MIVILELFLSSLTLRISQVFVVLKIRKINVELQESVNYLVHVLIDSDEVVVNEVSLPQLDPLLPLLFLGLQLIDIVHIMILA